MIGEALSSYRVVAKLGEGGMGVVSTAEHTLIGRRAAVKLLHAELSRNQEIGNRFFDEARAATLIRHPGIVDISDVGWHPSGCASFVMELLDGESLAARVRREGRLAPGMVCAIGQQVADAVAAAHDKGIIHRDRKPDDVFPVPDRVAACGVRGEVLEFGVAELATASKGIMVE